MQCSVLVNTANRPEFLERCLAAFYRQSCMDFEMVVADDGSDEQTLRVVTSHEREAPFPIRHIWHPPLGHRRVEILNKGIAACRTEYVIFTDCDSLAPSWFVEGHLRRRRPERMLIGGRIKLNRAQTDSLTVEAVRSGAFESLAAPAHLRALSWRHWQNVFEILARRKGRPHNLGLNMSMEMRALETVNGYDNEFRGWGNADGDLRERLRMAGIRPLSIWREVYIFHQWHPQAPRGEGNPEYARRPHIPMRASNGLAQAREAHKTREHATYLAFRESWLNPGHKSAPPSQDAPSPSRGATWG